MAFEQLAHPLGEVIPSLARRPPGPLLTHEIPGLVQGRLELFETRPVFPGHGLAVMAAPQAVLVGSQTADQVEDVGLSPVGHDAVLLW